MLCQNERKLTGRGLDAYSNGLEGQDDYTGEGDRGFNSWNGNLVRLICQDILIALLIRE